MGRRDPRKPRGPRCRICNGERTVDGPPIEKTFEVGNTGTFVTKKFPQRVACVCTKPKPPTVDGPAAPADDWQKRASGEGQA